jgi:hypothetical protein
MNTYYGKNLEIHELAQNQRANFYGCLTVSRKNMAVYKEINSYSAIILKLSVNYIIKLELNT